MAAGFHRAVESTRRTLFATSPGCGQYANTLKLLQANPQHPSLRLHALKGKLSGPHSVLINLSYRITLEMLITDSEIVPIKVEDHDELY